MALCQKGPGTWLKAALHNFLFCGYFELLKGSETLERRLCIGRSSLEGLLVWEELEPLSTRLGLARIGSISLSPSTHPILSPSGRKRLLKSMKKESRQGGKDTVQHQL